MKTNHAEILIAGAGVSGLTTALRLAELGAQVTVIDQGVMGKEASWAGGGILCPLYPWRYADAVNRLAAIGRQRYPMLVQELLQGTGIDPELEDAGMLVLDHPDARLTESEGGQWRAWLPLEDAVVPWQEIVDKVQPGLCSSPVDGSGGGYWWPDVQHVRNPRLLQALVARLRQLGATLLDHCALLSWQEEKSRVRRVETSQGAFTVGSLVVAAGPWIGRLLPTSGMHPIRGQMILIKAEPGVVSRMILMGGRYLIPRRDGRILVGSTVEDVGFDKSTDAEVRASLRSFAVGLFPALDAFPIEMHWAGLRPSDKEGLGIPLIGPWPGVDGLFVVGGHYRNGLVMAPGTAEIAADLVLGRTPAFAYEEFLPERRLLAV